jgi:hypothetical protein
MRALIAGAYIYLIYPLSPLLGLSYTTGINHADTLHQHHQTLLLGAGFSPSDSDRELIARCPFSVDRRVRRLVGSGSES